MIPALMRWQQGWLRASLLRQYVLIIGSLMAGALLISGGLDLYFNYQDRLNSISGLQREKASFAASNIDLFIGDIQRQLEQAARVEYEDSPSGAAARESDYLALVDRAPAITGLGYLDSDGKARFMIPPSGWNTSSVEPALSEDRIFLEAKANGTYNGPVYFNDNLVQHMTIGTAESGTGKGVLIADLDLSVVQDLILRLSLTDSGWAYVVDADGLVISHPVQEYAVQRLDVSHLPQVKSAIEAGVGSGGSPGDPVAIETSVDGRRVLAASFPIESLGWHVLLETPRSQALASLQGPMARGALVLVVGLVVAALTGLTLARKVASPVLRSKETADMAGSGWTDEEGNLESGGGPVSLNGTADRTSAGPKESYTALEKTIEQRTSELNQAEEGLEAEILEREKAERQAFMFRSAIEQSPIAVLITDSGAHIEYVNPKFTEITGYTLLEVMGKNPRFMQSGRTSRDKYERLLETINTGSQWDGEMYNRRKNGEYHWVFETILPIKDEHGRTTHYMALEHDISDQKKAEKDAQVASERLAEMNRTLEQRVTERTSDLQHANERLIDAHDQLVRTEKLAAIGELSAGVAHDLRNPLGAIKNAVYYLNGKLLNSESANENPRIPEFLKIIEDEVGHSNKIITDLLDFARITIPTFVSANLATLVRDYLGKIDVDARIRIDFQDNSGENNLEAQIDAEQLHRVFQNLILNAQDAMPGGGVITVSIEKIGCTAEISVSDTGEGIAPELIRKIFDPLFTTKTKGTGLGLAVCQQIVAQHGGTIKVDSQPGEGATFILALPLAVLDGLESEVQNARP